MFEVPLLIGGQSRAAADGRVFERRNPVTGELVSRVAAATLEDADAAVAAAQQAEDVGRHPCHRGVEAHDHGAGGGGLPLLRDLRLLDALHAVGAFFHHAAHADRDVRVALEVRRGADLLLAERTLVEVVGDQRVALVVVEEVEAADLVRTVIRTITGSDTAVVDHLVQSLMAVTRCCNRANWPICW